MTRLELLALVETTAASSCPAEIDRHEENEELDFLIDSMERWHDRKFNPKHTEH